MKNPFIEVTSWVLEVMGPLHSLSSIVLSCISPSSNADAVQE